MLDIEFTIAVGEGHVGQVVIRGERGRILLCCCITSVKKFSGPALRVKRGADLRLTQLQLMIGDGVSAEPASALTLYTIEVDDGAVLCV